MQLAIIGNNQVVKLGHYKDLFPNTSFPSTGADVEFMQANSCLGVTAWKPTTETQKLVTVEPYIENGQVFIVQVVDKTQEELDADAQSANAKQEAKEAARIESLWQAAHDYETAAISGSAVGLITLGVLQSLPKSLAVQAWIKSIWLEYYIRKAGTSTDTDFTTVGICPHSVPELMNELGV